MLILDEGIWNGTSCGGRAVSQFMLAILVIAALMLFVWLRVRLEKFIERRRRRHALETPPQPMLHSSGTAYLVGLLALAILCFATVASLSRSRDLLFTENLMLVETGCQRWQPYENRHILSDTEITYATRPGSSKRHDLIFKPGRNQRQLRVKLQNNGYLANLAKTAPDAMRVYAQRLRETGRRVPAAIHDL